MREGRWTPEEVERCRELVTAGGASHAARILDRTPESVCSKMKRIGHPIPKYIPPGQHPWRRPMSLKRIRQLAGEKL
jgi:hypothetical protein